MKVVPVMRDTLSMNSPSSVSTKFTSYIGVPLSSNTGSSAQAMDKATLSAAATQYLTGIVHPCRLKPVTAGRGGQGSVRAAPGC
jgi:hypothetical protein